MANKTTITAAPNKQELFITREFDAPRELVFKAFTTPEILLQFYAPYGIKMKFNYADFRSGGSYSWTHSDGAGKIYCTFKGVIHEILPPERMTQTVEMEDQPKAGNVILEIFDFEEIDNNKTKLIIQDVFRSIEDRDEMVQSGFEGGVVAIFEQLDELLIEGKIK
ncbi:SRPBCC domain-containing protein [Flavobacterium sp. UMI-01]|uniref:SRPBCC domain-containing protein n=1 Tax=Flavobacterium sp. UMI-01 TaxID=1441053 RepID=UPI001C7CC0B3|nr:SRPBCC domain-containing protein [Flavobacterium sp. UMI-01]GIZ08159.1 ATPase [Flavobacterium sp. UMI-01]